MESLQTIQIDFFRSPFSVQNFPFNFTMLIGFDQLLNNQLFSDCVISVNGEQFHAHRNILAAKSEYFG